MADASSRSTCIRCGPRATRFFTAHGLKIHLARMHRDKPPDASQPSGSVGDQAPSPSPAAHADPSSSPQFSFDDLARLRRTCRVIRNIPKGARCLAAGKLAELIDRCVDSNSAGDWYALLTFAFSGLRTPDSSVPGNLTSKVKRNIVACSGPTLDAREHEETNPKHSVVRAIEGKVFGGDIRGAVRLLMSDDTVAQSSPETLASLQAKHPPPSRPVSSPPIPDACHIPLTVKAEDVSQALGTFYSSSAAGLDGIRPGHLKELVSVSSGDSGTKLLQSLARLTNFMLNGQVSPEVCPCLYGASLCALGKKDGGIRPIAVGSVFRRLTAKLACRAVKEEMAEFLRPHQLGFGTALGCEAAIYATRAFVADPKNADAVVVKLDIRNAFNTLERDCMLSVASEKLPSLYPFLFQVYSSPSNLFYDGTLIPSQVGAQQGDPLGPLIFSLAIQEVIMSLHSPLKIWYLDDGTIGGPPDIVEADLKALIPQLEQLGLRINAAKCELFPCSPGASSNVNLFRSMLPGLKELDDSSFALLGSPIFPKAIPESFESRRQLLVLAGNRLKSLSAHVALVLLRTCLAVPKLSYFLRTCPTWLFQREVSSFDGTLKSAVESVLNVALNDAQWSQATLPIRLGGLGIRRAQDLGLPAFLASAHGVEGLVASILSLNGDVVVIPNKAEARTAWLSLMPGATTPETTKSQRAWDEVGLQASLELLVSDASGADLARLRAVSQAESGAWLHALPSPVLGTLLDDNSLRVAVGLRLGCDVCLPHLCICGTQVAANAHHALSCRKCQGRFPRHHALNDIISRALRSADIPCDLEPVGLCRSDGKRPDGVTLIPWSRGRCLLWDATCVNTVAASYIGATSRTAGSAAELQARTKHGKYAALASSYDFVPVAVETLGPWGQEARQFVDEIGRRLTSKGLDPRSGSFLVQRLAIAIQRGNAASVMGSFAPGTTRGGLFD